MSLIRPDLARLIARWREVILALCLVAAGLWLVWLGGWVLGPLGFALAALGLAWARHAHARLRFARAVGAPGVVELDEAQLAYLGPETGAVLSLDEAEDLRLLSLGGRRMWRLRQADGQAMLIPVDAAGADRLFDAFASLPGLDPTALSDALATFGEGTDEIRMIWRRGGQRALGRG